MKRKAVNGIIRNTERSRQKLLKAVGKIIKTKGFAALGVNHIAEVAKIDKKMIYQYFGGLDGLLDEYVSTHDFWSNVTGDKLPDTFPTGGKSFVKNTLLSQFEYVHTHPEFQKILLWRLSEQRASLKHLTDKQEENGEVLLQGITDPYFGERAEDFRAIMALLIAGSYYLNLYPALNGSTFCGIDLAKESGRRKVSDALSFLVDKTYDNLRKK